MSFDIEPDAPLHGECAAEIHRLELALSTIRQETIEECANLRFNIQPNGYGFNGRARLSWDLALQTYQETIRALKERK
jgi:hypothetical protein